MYYYRRHHYFRDTAIIIILLAVGAGGGYYYNQLTGNQPTQQTNRQATQGQSNQQSSNQSNNNQNGQSNNQQQHPIIHKAINKVKQNLPHSATEINKPGYTLSVLPKSIQGTWYSYDGGKLETLTITNNKITDNSNTTSIHARPKNTNALKASKHPNWGVALQATRSVRGLNFTNVRGWNQGAGDGADYAVFNDSGMTILDVAGGAEAWTDANFYKTPQQAKQNKKKIYKNHGERGYTD